MKMKNDMFFNIPKKRVFLISCCFIFFLLCLIPSIITWKNISKPETATSYEAAVYKIDNFHIISPGVMRGAQPPEEEFKILKDQYNVKTILSFRSNKQQNKWEKEIVDRLGMSFINIPMSAKSEQNIEKIERCLNIISDESNKPIFVHCHAGKDRTGLIFAAYRIKYGNWSFKDAFTEMLAYGYDQVRFYNLKKSLINWNSYVHKD